MSAAPTYDTEPPHTPWDDDQPVQTPEAAAEQAVLGAMLLDPTEAAIPPRTHALYRFYDANGALLYVGITLDPGARWRQHRDDKPWWHHVAHITIETHPDRPTVLEAERAAIRRERPTRNVVHNRAIDPTRTLVEVNDLMLAITGAPANTGPFGSQASHMPDDCHDICARNAIASIYYPYRWTHGTAHYQCAAGHTWTCGWGHDLSGDAPEHRGHPALEEAM